MKPTVNKQDFSNRSDWLVARLPTLGASETPTLYGVGFADQTEASLIAAKLNPENHEDDDRERLEIGNAIEPTLRELFMMRSKFAVYRSSDYMLFTRGVCSATPDALTAREDCPVELKNVDQYNARDWVDGPPLRVQVQVQQQLYCCDSEVGYVGALFGGNRFEWYRIDRHESFIEDIVDTASAWWQRYIVERYPAPLDVIRSGKMHKAIVALYPKDNGKLVELPPIAEQLWTIAENASGNAKQCEAVAKACRATIELMLGECTYGVLPSGHTLSFKTSNRKGYKVEPSRVRTLRTTTDDVKGLTHDDNQRQTAKRISNAESIGRLGELIDELAIGENIRGLELSD